MHKTACPPGHPSPTFTGGSPGLQRWYELFWGPATGSCTVDTTVLKSAPVSAELLTRFALVTLIQANTYSRDLSQGLAAPSCNFNFTLARPDLPPSLSPCHRGRWLARGRTAHAAAQGLTCPRDLTLQWKNVARESLVVGGCAGRLLSSVLADWTGVRRGTKAGEGF